MKIQITQDHLNRALNILSRVATNKTALPILSNILLKAEDSKLELSATNLEVAINHHVSSKVETSGVVAIPARLVSDFVASLPKDSTLSLVLEKNKLFISSGSYASHVQGANAEEFPALPNLTEGQKIQIDSEELKKILNRTMLAASHDETRPVLTGVYFHVEDGKLFLAATDGYRLAESTAGEASGEINAVVPLSALSDVLRIMQETEGGKAEIHFSDGQFGFRLSDTTMVSRLIDGEYPKYRQLIPANSEISAKLSREELLTAAKIAGLFARESGGSITISASSAENNLTISSVASQVGDNTSTLAAEVQGDGEVVLNVRYLVDALNCFEGDTINFRFSGSISPCVLTSPDQPGYQHIVMPLKS